MNDPQGPGGQGQPSDQPFPTDETVTRQHPQANWPNQAPSAGGPSSPPGPVPDYPATQQAPSPGFPAGPPPPSPGFPASPPPPSPGFAANPPAPGFPPIQQAPAAGFPMSPAPGLPAEPVLVTIGDISVTQSTVYTPSGSRPLGEVSWNVADMSVTSQTIPTWAIVCAVVFFLFCFLGLLFLLVKEYTTIGNMQVTVSGPGFVYTSSIPVTTPAQVADINARINYVRTVTAAISQAPYVSPLDQPPAPGTGQQPGRAW